MSDNLDPLKLISILHVILRDLEEMLSQAPERTDEVIDNRAIRLRNQIDRLKSVLTKHKDAQNRRKEIDKENKRNRGEKGRVG